jgi:hypothetical protein
LEFQSLLLAYLALIGEEYSGSSRPKPARRVQKLRRHATKIRNFAHWLKSSKERELILIPPSTGELLQYAEILSNTADRLAQEARTQRFHHSTHKATSLIIHLLEYVREATGKPHWKEIATLLKGACEDHGVNERRLQAMWSRAQKHGFRRRALSRLAFSPSITR